MSRPGGFTDTERHFGFADGFILAGGMSRRMGENKAGLKLAGKTFLERSADVLGSVSGSIRVVGDIQGLRSNLDVLPDIFGEQKGQGAIIGLLSALHYAESKWAAVLACDLPFVTADLFFRLVEIAKGDPAVGCVVPVQSDGRIQPLCGLYRPSESYAAIVDLYRRGERRLHHAIGQLKTRYVGFEELEDLPGSSNFFFNVNTRPEYEKALELANLPS